MEAMNYNMEYMDFNLYLDEIQNFGGVHFLTATTEEAGAINSDVDNDLDELSTSDDEDNESSSPKTKKVCAPLMWGVLEINLLKPFPFLGDSGVKVILDNPEPIDIFNQFFSAELFSKIFDETNRYARDLVKSDEANFGSWKPLALPEFLMFLGLFFHTGTLRMNSIADYWSPKKLFDFKAFRLCMTKNRFVRLLTALRVSRRLLKRDGAEDKIAMVKWLMEYFNTTMEGLCYPGRELIVDNCMAATRNGTVHKDTLDPCFCKPDLFLHSLSEPNGLIHRVTISENVSANNSSVIKYLMNGKTGRGHSIFLDRSYCNVKLVKDLILNQTYCTGILQPHSKNVPIEMATVKLTKGSVPLVRYCEPGICVVKWKNKEGIMAISSEFRSLSDNRPEQNEVRTKPLMLTEYRKLTHEVNRKEMMSSYRPVEGHSVGWYRAVIIHFFQLMMKNSYLIYNNNVKKMSFHDFRLSIIESLLKKEASIELIPPTIPEMTSDDALHVPRKFPKRQGQRSLRKRCRVCLQEGKRTDTYYHCPQCPYEPALCLEKCFAEYHSSLKSKPEVDS